MPGYMRESAWNRLDLLPHLIKWMMSRLRNQMTTVSHPALLKCPQDQLYERVELVVAACFSVFEGKGVKASILSDINSLLMALKAVINTEIDI